MGIRGLIKLHFVFSFLLSAFLLLYLISLNHNLTAQQSEMKAKDEERIIKSENWLQVEGKRYYLKDNANIKSELENIVLMRAVAQTLNQEELGKIDLEVESIKRALYSESMIEQIKAKTVVSQLDIDKEYKKLIANQDWRILDVKAEFLASRDEAVNLINLIKSSSFKNRDEILNNFTPLSEKGVQVSTLKEDYQALFSSVDKPGVIEFPFKKGSSWVVFYVSSIKEGKPIEMKTILSDLKKIIMNKKVKNQIDGLIDLSGEIILSNSIK